MTNFLSDPFENATVSSVDVVNSEDGAYRFGNENLASFNFDGAVPTVLDDAFEAQYLEPGMYFVVPGTDDTLRSVVEVSLDEDDPLDEMTIVYVGENSLLSTYTCDGSDILTVQYESWNEKVLGTQGWTITAGGNAIFSNVAVRGDIEAQTLNVGGTDGITYDGTDVVIGASVTILGGLTIGDVSASFVLSDFLTASYADLSDLASAGSTIISGGNILTGTVSAARIDVDNLVAKNLVTATSGSRIGITSNSSAYIYAYTGNASESTAGFINVFDGLTSLQMNLNSPTWTGKTPAALNLLSENAGSTATISANSILLLGSVTGTSFSGNGSSLTSLNASNISSGTLGTSRLSGTYPISISGNAATVSNGVYTTSTYSNPSWITSLAGSKISGNITGNASNITSYNINQNVGTGNSPTFAGLTSNGSTFVPDAYTATVSNRVVNVNAAGRLGNPSSSHTIKKNIIPLIEPDNVFDNIIPADKLSASVSDDSYKNILSITPVKFEWDIEGQTPGPEFGFIAEEIIEKMPESSLPGENGSLPYYKTTSLLASMLAVVKDQQKIIEDLQNRVLQLETERGA